MKASAIAPTSNFGDDQIGNRAADVKRCPGQCPQVVEGNRGEFLAKDKATALDVHDGEVIAIIGASGSGKSTGSPAASPS